MPNGFYVVGNRPQPVKDIQRKKYEYDDDANFNNYLKYYFNNQGFALADQDAKKGYKLVDDSTFDNLYSQAEYNWKTKNNNKYGDVNYNPWSKDKIENDAWVDFYGKNGRTPSTDEFQKHYTVNYLYNGQYADTDQDKANKEAGLKPQKYQTAEKTYNELQDFNEKVKKLGPNATYQDIENLFNQEATLSSLTKDARERANSAAYMARKYVPGVTMQPNLDLDMMHQLKYDDQTGYGWILDDIKNQQKKFTQSLTPGETRFSGENADAGNTPSEIANQKLYDPKEVGPVTIENALNPEYWEKAANLTTNKLKWNESKSDSGNVLVSNTGKEGNRYVIAPTGDGRYVLMWLSSNESNINDYKGPTEIYSNQNYAKWAAEKYRGELDDGKKVESEERKFAWFDRLGAWKKDPLRKPFPGGYTNIWDDNNWLEKLIEGNAFGGVSGALAAPQELYLNAWNAAMQAAKGEPITYKSGMTNRDYMDENAKRFGSGESIAAKLDKIPVVGTLANMGLEILTDPTNVLPGGMALDAIKSAKFAGELGYKDLFAAEKALGQRLNPLKPAVGVEGRAGAEAAKDVAQQADDLIRNVDHPPAAGSSALQSLDDVKAAETAQSAAHPSIKSVEFPKYTRDAAGNVIPLDDMARSSSARAAAREAEANGVRLASYADGIPESQGAARALSDDFAPAGARPSGLAGQQAAAVTDRVGSPLSYTPADLKIPDGITKANLSLTERLGNLFGKKVEAVQNLTDRAGNALGAATDPATGKVLVSNGQEGLAARSKLIAGGMSESLGKSGQYEAFRDAVLKSIPDDELAASVKKFQGIYGSNNPALIEREVVNEWVSNNLYNSPAIKQIVSADPQLATGVRNYFNELGAKLNGVDELKAVKQEVAQAEGMWERAGRGSFLESNKNADISNIGYDLSQENGGFKYKKAKKTYIYQRPSHFRKGMRDTVWNNNIGIDGNVHDPLTDVIMNKDEPWQMGHKPGYEFRKHQKSADIRGISRKQFLDEYNNPNHYWPELPKSNRCHLNEDMSDLYYGD